MHTTPRDPQGVTSNDLSAAVAIVFRRPLVVLGLPVVGGLVAALFFAFFGSYVARSSFVPQSSSSGLAGLMGIAAQFGTRLPGSLGADPTESLDFYASLIESPALLSSLADESFDFAKSETDTTRLRGTLVQLYGIDGDTEQQIRRNFVERMQNRVSVSVNRVNGTVIVSVKAPWPGLAQKLNRRLLGAANDFNLEIKRATAQAQREFLESRTRSAQLELSLAEDSLMQFSRKNRAYSSDPALALQAARLARGVDIRQAVYTTLLQSLEQSRLEEVRDTPLITVLDTPELFTKRSRSPLLMGVAALLFLSACTLTAVFMLQLADNVSRTATNQSPALDGVLAIARKWGLVEA